MKMTVKMNIFTSLLFLFCTFDHVFAGTVITKFQVQGESGGLGCSDVALEEENIVSLAQCASQCSKTLQCVGFIYKADASHCVRCEVMEVVLNTTHNTSVLIFLKQQGMTTVTDSPQTSVTSTSTAASTTSTFPDFLRRGEQCQTDTNCPQEFNLCLDGFCNCLAGYAYNHGTDSCDTGCVTYGSTYIAHTGKDFNADIIFISNEMTARDCSTVCSNNSICRGFSHSPTYDRGGWCSTQTSTPHSNPGHFFNSGNNFTYYIRNCN